MKFIRSAADWNLSNARATCATAAAFLHTNSSKHCQHCTHCAAGSTPMTPELHSTIVTHFTALPAYARYLLVWDRCLP
jgi:hypothetical protein